MLHTLDFESPPKDITEIMSRLSSPRNPYLTKHAQRPAQRPSQRSASPASSAGSHGSGASHPPTLHTRRPTIVTDISSDDLFNSINDWDDGFRPAASSSKTPPRRSSKSSRPKPMDVYICECCPEKPKKFDSVFSLRLHECSKPRRPTREYCKCCPENPKKFDSEFSLQLHESFTEIVASYLASSRFCDQDELVRHIETTGRGRPSWSCAALTNFPSAFESCQPSLDRKINERLVDRCGYCGTEFPNFPDLDWDLRISHLITSHKFGECEGPEKFSHADGFRRHIKDSHNGAIGFWTESLVKACKQADGLNLRGDPNHESGPSVNEDNILSELKIISEGGGSASSSDYLTAATSI